MAGLAIVLLCATADRLGPGLLGIVTALAVLMTTQMELKMDSGTSSDVYRELFDKSPQPIWVYDSETLAFLAVNEAAVRHYGYSEEEFLKMQLTDIRCSENSPHALEKPQAERPQAMRECKHRKKDGTVFPVEMVSRSLTFHGRPAVLALSTDILDHKRAEQRLRAFSNLGRRLSAARTPQEAARILIDTSDELFGWDACTFDLLSPDQNTFSTILCIDTIGRRRVDISKQCAGMAPSHYARQAIESGAQLVLRPPLPACSAPADGAPPSASLMYAPVRNNAKAIGVLSLQSHTPRAYSESDLRTLQALADHCGGALERIRAEQEIARLNGELEKRVRERTAQLESINKELETFSYSVSHDLRAPLRSIRGFSEVLLERHSSQLDERGREFLRRACESSQHMDILIEDLLKFSRVSRSELVRQPVNLSALAEGLACDLRKAEPERTVEVLIASQLIVDGDERLLRIALDNLLRNAWKFSGKQPAARIEFGFAIEPEVAFFVRDNGAGFDMQYAGKLFGVFQRLHSPGEFPGTGVGLATVQRIINRHGGRIWATGSPNNGATFYFTLPPEASS